MVCSTSLLPGGLLVWMCLFHVALIGQIAFTEQSPVETLESVRNLVAKNEALMCLIKMDYRLDYERTGDVPDFGSKALTSSGYMKTGDSVFASCEGVWAQDGIRQYSFNDYFDSSAELITGYINIVDGEVMKRAKPDLMKGKISKMEEFNWRDIFPALLGLRPFEAENNLSDILVPQYASLHKDTEMVDGRQVYVVDVNRPVQPVYFARIWIDRLWGVPLKLQYFDVHPTTTQNRLRVEVNVNKVHQLSNGGHLAVKGTRSVFFSGAKTWTANEHITIDVNSITTRREDIPDSLFSLTFPKGAKIYNSILGISLTGTGQVDDPRVNWVSDIGITQLQNPNEPSQKEPSTAVARNTPNHPESDRSPAATINQTKVLSGEHSATKRYPPLLFILFLFSLLVAFALTFVIGTLRTRNLKAKGDK